MENLAFILCQSTRYVNSLTISIAFPSYEKLIFWGNQPLEKIIILDLLELTLSFQILQYSQKKFSCNCRSDAEIKLHIVTQKVLNKYQILLRSHQIYNSSHIHSFLQETVGDHLNILRIRKGKVFYLSYSYITWKIFFQRQIIYLLFIC
jgi:hypothetical protein